jgi:hypothetical protein
MSEQDPNAGAWLEVSLTVDGELAEAVAEVLSRYAPNGVVPSKAQPSTRM